MGFTLQAGLYLLARGEAVRDPLAVVHAPLDVNPDIAMGLGAAQSDTPGVVVDELTGGVVDSPDPE
eukprot:4665568-Alexandrium_andersonii.AAC.1